MEISFQPLHIANEHHHVVWHGTARHGMGWHVRNGLVWCKQGFNYIFYIGVPTYFPRFPPNSYALRSLAPFTPFRLFTPSLPAIFDYLVCTTYRGRYLEGHYAEYELLYHCHRERYIFRAYPSISSIYLCTGQARLRGRYVGLRIPGCGYVMTCVRSLIADASIQQSGPALPDFVRPARCTA